MAQYWNCWRVAEAKELKILQQSHYIIWDDFTFFSTLFVSVPSPWRPCTCSSRPSSPTDFSIELGPKAPAAFVGWKCTFPQGCMVEPLGKQLQEVYSFNFRWKQKGTRWWGCICLWSFSQVIRRQRNACFVEVYISGAESEQGKAPVQLAMSTLSYFQCQQPLVQQTLPLVNWEVHMPAQI